MKSKQGAFPALYGKELSAFFDTPAAYVVTIVVLLISGYLFSAPLFLLGQARLEGFVDNAPLLFLFFIPAITMRLYSEEFKSGTIELLGTLPVRDETVLAAKYLGAVSLAAFMLAGTLVYPVTLGLLGRPDWGAVAGSYLGLFLTAALLAAVGTWASSLTRNQVVAFILSFLISFTLFLLGKVQPFMPPGLAGLADFLGLDSHLGNLARGVIDTRDLLYYATFTGFFLHLCYANLQGRRRA